MEALNANLFKFKIPSENEESSAQSGSEYSESEIDVFSELPQEIARRVYALENLQDKRAIIEADFKKELAILEKKYEDLYAPLYADRAKIINGEREVKEEEYAEREGSHVTLVDAPAAKGIPEFWLNVLKRSQLASLVYEADEPVLKLLRDIRTERVIDDEAPKLIVSFHFAPNEYFTNEVLTKTVIFNPEGNGIVGVTASPVDWKEGKNLAWKIVSQKMRHRSRPGVTATKESRVEEPSFFHFFEEIKAGGCDHDHDGDHDHDHEHGDNDAEARIMADAEICSFLDRYIVPSAVDWYTGRAMLEMEDEDGDYEFDEEDFEDEEEDSE